MASGIGNAAEAIALAKGFAATIFGIFSTMTPTSTRRLPKGEWKVILQVSSLYGNETCRVRLDSEGQVIEFERT